MQESEMIEIMFSTALEDDQNKNQLSAENLYPH
jgi:hypothetical protein